MTALPLLPKPIPPLMQSSDTGQTDRLVRPWEQISIVITVWTKLPHLTNMMHCGTLLMIMFPFNLKDLQ